MKNYAIESKIMPVINVKLLFNSYYKLLLSLFKCSVLELFNFAQLKNHPVHVESASLFELAKPFNFLTFQRYAVVHNSGVSTFSHPSW